MRRTPARDWLRWTGVALLLASAVAVAVGLRVQARSDEALPGAATRQARSQVRAGTAVASARGGSFVQALAGKRPLFIVAIGSDARPGQQVDRQRADSIHLIGINPVKRRATILGFPRDSYVNIPGYGRTKINEAMVAGGPERVVSTIESLTGIQVDFWLLTSFEGLRSMVNGIGGVILEVRYPMFDPLSGTSFNRGRHFFAGGEALAFTRDRHSTPRGDFDRSFNQGRLMLAALVKLRSVFQRSPAALLPWIPVLWRHVDTNLGPGALIDLAITATLFDPSKVRNLVVPGAAGSAGAASVVYISGSASQIYADMRRDGFVA